MTDPKMLYMEYPYTVESMSIFPQGPWESEPNQRSWIDQESRIRCAVIRHYELGHLCGYVRIPHGHPFFGLSYQDEVEVPLSWRSRDIDSIDIGVIPLMVYTMKLMENGTSPNKLQISEILSVHGGITYSDNSWFGFDCSHYLDWIPSSGYRKGQIYRDFDFAMAQCRRLAKQIREYPEALEEKKTTT